MSRSDKGQGFAAVTLHAARPFLWLILPTYAPEPISNADSAHHRLTGRPLAIDEVLDVSRNVAKSLVNITNNVRHFEIAGILLAFLLEDCAWSAQIPATASRRHDEDVEIFREAIPSLRAQLAGSTQSMEFMQERLRNQTNVVSF